MRPPGAGRSGPHAVFCYFPHRRRWYREEEPDVMHYRQQQRPRRAAKSRFLVAGSCFRARETLEYIYVQWGVWGGGRKEECASGVAAKKERKKEARDIRRRGRRRRECVCVWGLMASTTPHSRERDREKLRGKRGRR